MSVTWSFNTDGSITGSDGTIKKFHDLVVEKTTTYSSNATLGTGDLNAVVTITGGTTYYLPSVPVLNSDVTILNNSPNAVTITVLTGVTIGGSTTFTVTAGGVTRFRYTGNGVWVVKSSSKNFVLPSATAPTDAVTLSDLMGILSSVFTSQASVKTVSVVPQTLTANYVGSIVKIATSSTGILTLFPANTDVRGTYPVTLFYNAGLYAVTLSADADNSTVGYGNTKLSPGNYCMVVGGSDSTFKVIVTSEDSGKRIGSIAESGVRNITTSTALSFSDIGAVVVYGATSTGNGTVTLMSALSTLNQNVAKVTIFNGSNYNVTIAPSGSDTLLGTGNILTPGTHKTLLSLSPTASFIAISDSGDGAKKNGDVANKFTVAAATVGTDAINGNAMYSELVGHETYNGSVTINHIASRGVRNIRMIPTANSTLTLPPLSSANIAGGGVTINIVVSGSGSITVTPAAGNSVVIPMSNVLPTGAFVSLTYNAGETAWLCTAHNIPTGSSLPLINGTATPGTSLQTAKADHVHPTDTSLQPLSSVLTDFVNSQKLPVVNYDNADANNIAWSCIAVIGANVANTPANPQFILTHYWSSVNIHQTCYTREDGGIFTRRSVGAGWTTWIKSEVEKSITTTTITTISLAWNTFRLVNKFTFVYISVTSSSIGSIFVIATIQMGLNEYAATVALYTNSSGYLNTAMGNFPVPSGASYKLTYTGVAPTTLTIKETA